jgi:SpoVK/Ycf46/Vps4 family AAA+-type ATPase
MDRMNAKLLQFMEQKQAHGIFLKGPPGTGKSHLAAATGSALGVLTLVVNLGDMMGPHVGESEAYTSAFFKALDAMGDHPLFLAAMNSDGNITPEMERRFRKQFIVDLPSTEEKKAIWEKQIKAHGLEPQPLPNDMRWSGADIRNCCQEASMFGLTLAEAAQEIGVPVGIRRAEVIDKMRVQCIGTWRSASYPGVYKGPEDRATASVAGRLMETS